jgi:hypothetical protein
MKQCFILLVICVFFNSCWQNKYGGTVFDYEAKKPVSNVMVSSQLGKVYTDHNGYFSIPKKLVDSRVLIFSKAGYTSDTIETSSIQSGEFVTERFRGDDTVYFFLKTSNFRDSVKKLNAMGPGKL